MKLTQLEYFCVAARYHNITRASKELFVTQPSVSNAIKALEEEFGINLFYRNNNKLTLTPEGEKFYQSAEELLAHADAVRSELHELRKQITPIRIGIPPMLGTIYLPDMYLSLKEEFPDVDLRLYEYGSIKACELVLEEKLEAFLENTEGVGKAQVILMTDEKKDRQSFYNSETIQVTGVLISAEGGGNPVVVQNIQEAVMALFQVDAHRIRIMKMK
mgnify:CR=1 FL=1